MTNNKNNELISTTELIHIEERFNEQTEQLEQTVSAREIYALLESSTDFRHWWKRGVEFLDLEEGRSFLTTPIEIAGNKTKDYILPVDTAKEICMVSRTEKAKEIRKYFIQVEKAWNDPNMIMKRAYQVLEFRLEKSQKALTAAKPAIEFYDAIGDAKNNKSWAEIAQELGTGRNRFVEWCREQKIVKPKPSTSPYQQFVDQEYFDVIEVERNGYNVSTTLITPKGLKFLTNKYISFQHEFHEQEEQNK